jgi:HlyD family secretion protein
MKKKILTVLIVVSLLGVGTYYVMGRNNVEEASSNMVMVNLQELKPQKITTKVSADGNIKTITEEEIKINLNGFIEQVYVDEGDRVAKGQRLIKLDEKRLENTLETVRLTLQEAEKNYDNLWNTYQSQDDLNSLRLKEVRRNLKISVLSRDKEYINLENQKHSLKDKLNQAERNMKNMKGELEDKRHLYNNKAVPKNEVERALEEYKKAKESHEQLQHELDVLIEKTIPNSMELAELKVENARNSLNLLEANIARDRITKTDLELADIKVIKAEREITDIKNDLQNITTVAPSKGTILDIKVKSGDKVTQGSTVGKVANLNNLMVEVMVDEIDVNDVKLGQKVYITSDSFAHTLEGKIDFIAPMSTKVGNINKYKTKIKLKDFKGLVRPGMFVNAEIITNQKENIIAVPSMAVMGGKDNYVFVAKEGKTQKRSVELGLKSLSKVEIKGVKAGEQVIMGPFKVLKDLKPGTPITGRNMENSQ